MIGSTIAHYRITAKLGEGGMGSVYRATDTKLNREVAIKVLPDSVAGDPDRLARFTREAQVLASLNHPRIAAIYGVEDRALVMELVEGETIADRIARGPIPREEALHLARQVAEALEAAHEKGVIHRDLKPANVKITPDGEVKVLDFGLAKVNESAPAGSSNPAASPTLTLHATQAGIILGTAAYMAPEQARGAAVDKRADIWAFGCVLYEMLSGKRTFDGDSTTDVLAAVVRAEPDWTLLPPATPAPVLRLLKRCLQKDRKRRLPDIGVARLDIDDALAAPEPAVATLPPKPRSARPWIALAAAVVLVVLGILIGRMRSAPQPETWSGVMLGGPAKASGPRLSPDGQLIAFLAMVDQLPQLAVMKPNGGSWTILTTDREHGYVTRAAWASDGSKIYFDRMLGHPMGVYSVPPLGGESRLLLDDAFAPEALPDGSLIVAKLTDQGDEQLFHFWPDSGKLEALPAFLPETDVALTLRAFPDGKGLVYFGTGESDRSKSPRLLVFDLASHRARELSPGLRILPPPWLPLAVSPDGASVYVATQAGDTERLVEVPSKPGGAPRALLSFPSSARALTIDATADGSLYLDLSQTPYALLEVNASGGAAEEKSEVGSAYTMVERSGDVLVPLTGWGRQRLAMLRPGAEPRVLVETSEDATLPATTFGGNVAFVIGTGDQRRIALASLRDGRVFRRFSTRSDSGLVASPDGNTLYYSFSGAIWAQPVAGGEPRRITEGIDVTLDPKGQYLYVKRANKGAIGMIRMPVAGGDAEELPVPPEYHVADPGLSPAAVDERGRVLVTVVSNHSFYYHTAILDPATKSFTLVPVTVDGDCARAGWAPQGRILAQGERYLFSMWRYQRSKTQ